MNLNEQELKIIEINDKQEIVKKSNNINKTLNNEFKKYINQENLQEKKEEINLMEDDDIFQSNKRLIIENGIAFYLDENSSEYFYYNISQQRIKENYQRENIDSMPIFNENFFS